MNAKTQEKLESLKQQIAGIEAEETMRLKMIEMDQHLKQTEKYAQDSCLHIAGANALSDSPDIYNRTSIVWHTFRDKQEIGICSICGRQFRPEDPDYFTWRNKKSINYSSSDRDFITYPEGDEVYADDWEPQLDARQMPILYKEEGFESLSDANISFLIEGCRQFRNAQKNTEDFLSKHFSGPQWTVKG